MPESKDNTAKTFKQRKSFGEFYYHGILPVIWQLKEIVSQIVWE